MLILKSLRHIASSCGSTIVNDGYCTVNAARRHTDPEERKNVGEMHVDLELDVQLATAVHK